MKGRNAVAACNRRLMQTHSSLLRALHSTTKKHVRIRVVERASPNNQTASPMNYIDETIIGDLSRPLVSKKHATIPMYQVPRGSYEFANEGWLEWLMGKIGMKELRPVASMYASIAEQSSLKHLYSNLYTKVPQTGESMIASIVLHLWVVHSRLRRELTHSYHSNDRAMKRHLFWFTRTLFDLAWHHVATHLRTQYSDVTHQHVKFVIETIHKVLISYDHAWHIYRQDGDRQRMCSMLWQHVYSSDYSLDHRHLTYMFGYVVAQMNRVNQWSQAQILEGNVEWNNDIVPNPENNVFVNDISPESDNDRLNAYRKYAETTISNEDYLSHLPWYDRPISKLVSMNRTSKDDTDIDIDDINPSSFSSASNNKRP